MANRREMMVGDWITSAGLCAVGVYLGLAVHGMSHLVGTVFFWPMLMFVILMWGALFLFENVTKRFFDWMFPSGIKPAKNPSEKERSPLTRVLSLPAGIVLGVILAELDFTDALLFVG